MSMISIAKRRHKQYPRGITKPYRRKQKRELNRREIRVYRRDDQGAVVLEADAYADNAKVHDDNGPDAPVDAHAREIGEGPAVVGGGCGVDLHVVAMEVGERGVEEGTLFGD